MLVVKIELWPGGDPSRAREIGRAGIANVTDLAATSDYLVITERDGAEEHAFMVRKHVRSDGYWPLLERVARAAQRPPGKRPSRVPARLREVSLLLADRMHGRS